MKKMIFFAAFVLAIAFSGRIAAQEVTVSYKVNRIPGGGSNQIAVWVEDAAGKYVRTIYASAWTATGGYTRRPLSLSVWIEKSDWANASKAEVDAVSGSTQPAGDAKVVWNLKDKEGNRVPNGKYVIRMEANIKNEIKMFSSAEVSVGGPAAQTKGEITYTSEEASTGDKVFENVVVDYK